MYISRFDHTEEFRRRELYKIIVARSDVTSALNATQLFLERVDNVQHPLFLSLQEMIIISYSRPFTQNEPYGQLSDKWSQFGEKRLARMHARILKARNERVAHSDFNSRKVIIVPPGQRYPTFSIGRTKEIGVQVSGWAFTLETFPVIEELCMNLGSRLNDEVHNRLEQLFPHTDTPGRPFDLLPKTSKQILL